MNPRAAINDLLPFQGSPFSLLGTSPQKLTYDSIYKVRGEGISSGEGGIRTHAPLRTNGFQDRLVMTTSISLRIHFSVFFALLCQRKTYSIIELRTCQHLNLHFFIFFQKSFCNIKIFWCCDLDILVGAFYQADLGAFFLLYYHGIIGDS